MRTTQASHGTRATASCSGDATVVLTTVALVTPAIRHAPTLLCVEYKNVIGK